MKSDSPETEVRRFYTDATLSDARVDEILSQGRAYVEARRRKRAAGGTILSLAGLLLVCLLLLFRTQGAPQAESSPAETSAEAMEDAIAHANIPVSGDRSSEPRMQLIAVHNHGDQCPHCRASIEAYSQLKAAFVDVPIEFRMIDLRDDSESFENSYQEFQSLGLNVMVQGPEKALIAIAEPNGKLHRLDLSLGTEQLKKQVADMLRAE